MPYVEQPPATLEGELSGLSKKLLQLQKEMNTALEELLEVRASMDYCHWELDLGAELVVCHNDTQLTEAKRCHTAIATALQWAHLDNISALNTEMMAEEGQKCQAFTKKFSAALQACPSEDCWALIPPTTLDWWHFLSPPLMGAMTDTGSIPTPLTLSMLDTPMPQPSIKWWHHSSNQGMPDPGQDKKEAPDDMPEDPPCKKWKPMVKAFKEA